MKGKADPTTQASPHDRREVSVRSMGGGQRLGIGLVVAALTLAGILPATGNAARAATLEDYNVSQQGQTTQQATGSSPDGDKICVVWTQFDVADPQLYFRLYDTSARSWSPALNAAPFQVSATGNVNRPRCAIDTPGNVHVVWQQKHRNGDGSVTGQLDLAYRRLGAGGNAADGNSWTGIQGLGDNRSAVDIDAVPNAGDGRVWIVSRLYREGGSSALDVRSWNGNTGWDNSRILDTGGQADGPRIAADVQGFVHIVFRNGGASGINYVYLGPTGNFGPRIAVPNGANAGSTDIAVDRGNGNVHIVFAKDFTKLYYAQKSYNSGFSLTQIDEGSDLVDDPSVAWSANGRLTVTYSNNKGGEVDIQTSGDGGKSWSGRGTLSSPAGGVSAPWLTADRNGVSYTVYNRRAAGAVFVAIAGDSQTPLPAPLPAPTPTAPTPPDVPEAPVPACFAQTNQCVRGLFLAYWQLHGGLAVNGYPLSGEFAQTLADGQTYTVQYFERVRLEYHPGNDPANQVLIGQFGRRVHPADPPSGPAPGAVYFAETGHNITRAAFADYYAAHGGLAQFGYPLSEEYVETLEDGQQYTVQYFERARFEFHPENIDPANQVLLGQFGRRFLAETSK